MSEIRPKTQYTLGAITAIHGNGSAFDVNVNGRSHDMTKLRGSFDTRGLKVGDRVIVAWAEDNSFLPFILDVAGTKKRASASQYSLTTTPTEPPSSEGTWLFWGNSTDRTRSVIDGDSIVLNDLKTEKPLEKVYSNALIRCDNDRI